MNSVTNLLQSDGSAADSLREEVFLPPLKSKREAKDDQRGIWWTEKHQRSSKSLLVLARCSELDLEWLLEG